MKTIIEPGISPLVDAMNATGVFWTVASCEGHRWSGEPPYVYFVAPVEAAASLDALLEEDFAKETPRLANYWLVRGMFFRGELRFQLSAPSLEKRLFWSRTALASDIRILANLMRQLGEQFWQEHEPTVGEQHGDKQEGDYVSTQNVSPPPAEARHCFSTPGALPGGMTDAFSALTTRDQHHKQFLVTRVRDGILSQSLEVRS